MKHNIIPKKLTDLLATDAFIVSLLETARISGDMESSFRVYGDQMRYHITEPMEEELTKCLQGIGKHGIVYHIEGKGLYLPKGKSSIVDVHFHPKGSIAIPSTTDMNSTYSNYLGNRCKMFSGSESPGIKYLIPTSIVGLKSGNSIDLFFYQPDNLDIENFDSDFFNKSMSKGARDINGRLLPSMKSSPQKFAKMLGKTGKYLASMFTFSGKKDYLTKIISLNNFELTADVKIEDYSPEQLNSSRDSQEDFGMIDAEEELRRLTFY